MGKTNLREIYKDNTSFRYFLLCILISGLGYGLYKGMLDNYLAEVVQMGEMDRGITEFFREIPGIALVFILAVFYMLSAETMFKVGAVITLCGMGMHALLPPTKVLATLAICVYSLGEHIQLGMKSTLSLQYALPGRGGAAQGVQNSVNQVGTLLGYLVIVAAFSAFHANAPYKAFSAWQLFSQVSVCSAPSESQVKVRPTKTNAVFIFTGNLPNIICWRCSTVPESRYSSHSALMC